MSEPIKVGDLVVVVRDCCGAHLGLVFEVESIQPPSTGILFSGSCCGKKWRDTSLIAVRKDGIRGHLCKAPLSWLRKIPPLWELDEIEHKEEQPA